MALVMGVAVIIGTDQHEGAGSGAILLILIFLPVGQLIASILTLFCIASWSAGFPQKRTSLLELGRITLYSILGALVGGIGMVFGFGLFK